MTGLSNLALRELQTIDNKVVMGGGKTDNRNSSKSKKSKNVKSRIQTHIRATKEPIFLTSVAKNAFT